MKEVLGENGGGWGAGRDCSCSGNLFGFSSCGRLTEYNVNARPQNPHGLGDNSSFISDATGYAIQHLQYLPFGEAFVDQQAGTFDSRYKFSAKEKDDETQYSYFGARYYDSDLSVWLSVDPLSDKYPSTSAYMYCLGNPIGLIDQYGLSSDDPQDVKRWGLGTRFFNWISGDGWRNKSNKFIVENGLSNVRNNEDGTISAFGFTNWSGVNSTMHTGGTNITTYTFSEGGYSTEYSNSHTMKTEYSLFLWDSQEKSSFAFVGLTSAQIAFNEFATSFVIAEPTMFGEALLGVINLGFLVFNNYDAINERTKEFSAEHTNNARKSTWGPHTKRRPGKDYGSERNKKRGDKNKKYEKRKNPNIRRNP